VGRRVRPAQPTWQLRTSVLSLREACLTAVRASMENVRFLSCGFRSSSCISARALAGCLYSAVAVSCRCRCTRRMQAVRLMSDDYLCVCVLG